MPKVIHFERDLVDIRITRKAHTIIRGRKRDKEPIHRVVDRMVASYCNNDASDWEEFYFRQVDITKKKMKEIEELQKQIKDLKQLKLI